MSEERVEPSISVTSFVDLAPSTSVTSFQVPVDLPQPKGIWETLRKAIEKEVSRNDIPKGRLEILPDQTVTEEAFIQEAVDTIFHDVAEFYAWYFNPDDDRTIWIGEKAATNRNVQGQLIPWTTDMPKGLREPVAAVVESNLDAMRDVDEIPAGQDTDSLGAVITDALVRYIANWSAWYYDRWELDQIENYLEQKSIHDEIYYGDDDYGDLSNLLDDGQFDGVSDIPFISEKEAPDTKQSLSLLSMVALSEDQLTASVLEQQVPDGSLIVIDGEEFISIGGIFKKVKSLVRDVKKVVSDVVSDVVSEAKETVSKVAKEIPGLKEDSEKQKEEGEKGEGSEKDGGGKDGRRTNNGKGGNECHDERGRFCSTGDWPKNGGRKIKKVSGPGNVTLAGKEGGVQGIWEVEAKDGTKLKLYDIDNKSTEKEKKVWLDSLAKNHEMNPMKPPAYIVQFGADEASWLGAVQTSIPQMIAINDSAFTKGMPVDKKMSARAVDGHFMPSGRNMTAGDYVVSHEYGHSLNFSKDDFSSDALFKQPEVQEAMSGYGRGAEPEAYAEAYAEWHGSQGKTTNLAAIAYASWENWYGYTEPEGT